MKEQTSYDTSIGIKITAYNFVILLNQIYLSPKIQIMDGVV